MGIQKSGPPRNLPLRVVVLVKVPSLIKFVQCKLYKLANNNFEFSNIIYFLSFYVSIDRICCCCLETSKLSKLCVSCVLPYYVNSYVLLKKVSKFDFKSEDVQG